MTWCRTRWPLLAITFVSIAAIAAGTAAASPQRVTRATRAARAATRISGRIVDDQGNPLSGVVVDAESEISYADFHTARTGADGRYSISSTPGPQQLTVDGSRAKGGDADGVGYTGSRAAMVLARYGRTTTGVNVTMHPGSEIRGRVTDAAGSPLSGVTAWLADIQPYVYSDSYDEQDQAAGTEAVVTHNGTFRIGGVRAGAYQLCFDTTSTQVTGGASDRAGYETTCGSRVVAVAAKQVTRVDALSLARSGGGVVFGRVTGRDGRPVAGVQVETHVNRYSYDAVTGRDGYYRIQDLPTGSTRVCYRTYDVDTSTATGFAPACRATRLAVTAGQTYRLDRTLRPGGAVRGAARVTGGAPVAGVIVDGMWGQDYGTNDVTTETGDAGRFVLKNLPATGVDVCFSPDFSAAAGPGDPFGAVGDVNSCRTVRARPSRVLSGINESFARAGAISGTVRDQNGRPLSNVQVDLEGDTDYGNEGEFYAVTDTHGRYRAVDLPPVKFEVCYSNTFFYEKCYRKPGAKHASELRVRSGHNISGIDATLSTVHNHVRVDVVDSDGHPLPGADAVLLATCSDPTDDECLAQPAAGKQTYTVYASDIADADGRVTWPAVGKGTYTVCAFGYYAAMPTGTPTTGYGDACSPTALTVTATGDQTVRIALPTDGAVTGRVTNSAGQPLADVRVHISGSAADDFADADYDSDTPTPHWDAYTDANGDYTVRSVAPGAQTACFDPRYVTDTTTYQPQCLGLAPGTTSGGATVSISSGATTTGIDMALSPKTTTGSRPAAMADRREPAPRYSCTVGNTLPLVGHLGAARQGRHDHHPGGIFAHRQRSANRPGCALH